MRRGQSRTENPVLKEKREERELEEKGKKTPKKTHSEGLSRGVCRAQQAP